MGESNGYPLHGELRVGQVEERGQSSSAAEQHPLAGGRLLYCAWQESFCPPVWTLPADPHERGQSQQGPKGCVRHP